MPPSYSNKRPVNTQISSDGNIRRDIDANANAGTDSEEGEAENLDDSDNDSAVSISPLKKITYGSIGST